MTLSKKRVELIVVVIVVALVGLLTVQAVLIRTAWESKEQAFRRSVFAALDLAVKKLEAGEAMSESVRMMGLPHPPTWSGVKVVASRYGDSLDTSDVSLRLDRMCDTIVSVPVKIERDSVIYTLGSPQHVTISIVDHDSGVSRTVVDTFRSPGRYAFKMKENGEKRAAYMFRYESDTNSFLFKATAGTQKDKSISIVNPDPQKQALVQRVLTQMLTVELQSVEQRIDSLELDSIIGAALREQGISMEHAYGVMSAPSDSMTLVAPAIYRAELETSPFRTRLFPQDLLSRPASIVLYFPGHEAYVWRQIGAMLTSVTLFMLVIVFCFGYAIRVITRQRQFASRMTDFINNMTHEFKTPIATVSLASEAIAREDVISDPDRLTRFNRMIQDETARMRTHVDKILQMAVLEEGDYDLNLTEVDIHALVNKAVENAALHVAARGGTIHTDLAADQPAVMADRVHISNVIQNLLDNANKYSPQTPTIVVTTRNVAGGIEIAVTDQGIGIHESDQKAIFDKYFRVTNGNVHNVKGFGLGLSYVKLMVTAHGGTISIDSILGAGTTVRVVLPIEGPLETRR